MYAHPQLLRWQ